MGAPEVHGVSDDYRELRALALARVATLPQTDGGWDPQTMDGVCCDWAACKIPGDERAFDVLPDVLRAWVRFAGERRGIPAAAIRVMALERFTAT